MNNPFLFHPFSAVKNLTGGGFSGGNPNWDKLDEIMPICTENYSEEGEFMVYYPDSQTNEETRVHLYPNPNNGESVILEYDFLSDEPVHLELFELSGKKVYEQKGLDSGLNSTSLTLPNLKGGMYLVHMFTNSERKIVRLIIH